jgi:predicted glycogen debranching enzyme
LSTAQHFRVSREECRDFARSPFLEWLETDGLGGFAMGTVAGVATRRYHGLLTVARHPPVDRTVILSKLEESLVLPDGVVDLATTQYPGIVHPAGFRHLESFCLAPFPTWTWEVNGLRLEKTLFLVHGRATVVVQYRAQAGCSLRVRPFVAFRDFHALTRENPSFDPRTRESTLHGTGTVRIRPYATLPALYLHYSGQPAGEPSFWYRDVEYLEELARGLDFREDLYGMAPVRFDLRPGQPGWIVATIHDEDAFDAARVVELESAERSRRRPRAHDPLLARLDAAADSFLVRRADGSPTIIAGYPWFADWGRDTMIALPGLLLARGLLDEARDVLAGFLAHMDRGIIPNRFADGLEPPEYNTADGTLWLFRSVEAYAEAGGDRGFVRDVFYPRAKESLEWHARGTHYGIRVDPSDGLLVAGDPGSQLTWMDARVGDRVVTPRHGKPVEINALYFNALRFVESLAAELGDEGEARACRAAADRLQGSFLRLYWDARRECLFDVVHDSGPDGRMRPNQIFAVSLPRSMLSAAQMQRVVRAVEKALLTPYGLRTLAPDEAEYHPHYRGSMRERDGAYHQGTVWPWLLGPFVTAYLRAFGSTHENIAHCRGLVAGLERHLGEACLGTVSEIFDGDPPHAPGGSCAQAWSVGELYRVLACELR